MTREIHVPLAIRLATIGGALLLAMFFFAGCSDSKADAGRNTNLEPDDGDSSVGEKSSAADDRDGAGGQLPDKPSAAAPINVDPLTREIPEAPAEIWAYIQQLQHRPPARTLEEEELALMALEKTVTCAEKLIATDDKQMQKNGTITKLQTLSRLAGYGLASGEERLGKYCDTLLESDDEKIMREAELARLGLVFSRFRRNEIEWDQCLEQLNLIVTKYPLPPEDVALADNFAAVLMNEGQPEKAVTVMKLVGNMYKDIEDENVAARAKELTSRAEHVAIRTKFQAHGIDQEKVMAAAEGDAQAADDVIGTVKKMLAEEPLDHNLFGLTAEAGWFFEITKHYEASAKVYDAVAEAYKNVEDEDLAAIVAKKLSNAQRRLALVGKPLTLHTVTLDGKPFDWNQYKGKTVLVFCWGASFQESYEEMAKVVHHYDKYREHGFEVASLNFDNDPEVLNDSLEHMELPWPTQVSADSVGVGLESALANQLGLDFLPFAALVGPDGKVVAIHVQGEELTNQLTTLFGPDKEATPATESKSTEPETGKPKTAEPEQVEPEPAKPEPKTQTPADQPPGPEEDGAAHQQAAELEYFVSFDESGEFGSCDDEAEEGKPRNPYLAPSGLTTSQLVDYVLDMEEKPGVIKDRPGFTEAMIEVAQRLITNETEGGTYWRIGVVTKFKYLHRQSANDDKEADKALLAFLEKFRDSTDKRIAREVRFLQMERRVLEGTELPVETIEAFLAELKEYYAAQRLSDRHLRMASATVALINRIDSEDADEKDELGDKRENYFTEFGELFAKSSNRELKDYGKKLAKKPTGDGGGTIDSDLVGKPLELAGQTAAGKDFDWKSYRGKIVIVDFWATWCGPCIREMPHVREFFEKNHDRGFEVVGVSLDKDLGALDKFIKDNKVPWENLSGDGTQALATKYGVRGIPTMMLVDRDGNVVAVSHNLAALTGKANELLGMASPKKTPDDPGRSSGEKSQSR